MVLVRAELILQLIQNGLYVATEYNATVVEGTWIVRPSLELGLVGAQSLCWDRTQLYGIFEHEVRVHLRWCSIYAAGARQRVATVVVLTALYDDSGVVNTESKHIATLLIAISLHVINVNGYSHFKLLKIIIII